MEGKGLSRRSILILFILIILTPLGLIAGGEAWGEWDISKWPVPDSWRNVASKLAEVYVAPLSGYNIPGWNNGILPYIGYILSAFIGTTILIILTYIIGYLVIKGKRHG